MILDLSLLFDIKSKIMTEGSCNLPLARDTPLYGLHRGRRRTVCAA